MLIKPILYLQCIQMMMSNFNKYEKGTNIETADGFTNFQALNFVQTVFPVIFNLLNCILISLVYENRILKMYAVYSVFII
jgi:hypothetical protein